MPVASGRPLMSGTMVCSWALTRSPNLAVGSHSPQCQAPQLGLAATHVSAPPKGHTRTCILGCMCTEGAVSLRGTKLYLNFWLGTCLVVQWLRLCTYNAGGMGSIPGPATTIPHAVRYNQKVKKKKKKLNFWLTWIIDWFMQNSDSFHLDIWKEEDKTANLKPWTKQLETSFSAFTDILNYST